MQQPANLRVVLDLHDDEGADEPMLRERLVLGRSCLGKNWGVAGKSRGYRCSS